MTTAIILSAGVGKRVGSEIPKQFLLLHGKPVLAYSLEAFQSHSAIDRIVIVCPSDYIQQTQEIAAAYGKVYAVVEGGKERYHSAWIGLQAAANTSLVLLHDAARPGISLLLIDRCIEALQEYRAVSVVLPASETVFEIDENNCVENIPSRSKLRMVQTPQAFDYNLICQAYKKAMQDPNLKATDDCGIVKKYVEEEPIFTVEGQAINRKLTQKEDFFILEYQISQIPNSY